MDAPIFARSVHRSPSARRVACIVAALLAAATASADTTAARFDVRAAIEAKPVVPAADGFELKAKLAPLRKTVEGGGYSIDATAAPAEICNSSGDTIFANGFENPG